MVRQYQPEDHAEDDSRLKLPSTPPAALSKHGVVKRSFDFLITTPGKLRRGVARHGNALEGFVDYNIKLFRSIDREWACYLEWVDLNGEGHRLVLPHAVVEGILQRANSIMAQCRKERAMSAARTRRINKGGES